MDNGLRNRPLLWGFTIVLIISNCPPWSGSGSECDSFVCQSAGYVLYLYYGFRVANPSPLSSLCKSSRGIVFFLWAFLARTFLRAGVGHGCSQSGTSIGKTSRDWNKSSRSAGHLRKKRSVGLRIIKWKGVPHLYVKPCFLICSRKGLSIPLRLWVALESSDKIVMSVPLKPQGPKSQAL